MLNENGIGVPWIVLTLVIPSTWRRASLDSTSLAEAWPPGSGTVRADDVLNSAHRPGRETPLPRRLESGF
jgi:hypothetical protein